MRKKFPPRKHPHIAALRSHIHTHISRDDRVVTAAAAVAAVDRAKYIQSFSRKKIERNRRV